MIHLHTIYTPDQLDLSRNAAARAALDAALTERAQPTPRPAVLDRLRHALAVRLITLGHAVDTH